MDVVPWTRRTGSSALPFRSPSQVSAVACRSAVRCGAFSGGAVCCGATCRYLLRTTAVRSAPICPVLQHVVAHPCRNSVAPNNAVLIMPCGQHFRAIYGHFSPAHLRALPPTRSPPHSSTHPLAIAQLHPHPDQHLAPPAHHRAAPSIRSPPHSSAHALTNTKLHLPQIRLLLKAKCNRLCSLPSAPSQNRRSR